MKRIIILIFALPFLFTSCMGGRKNQNITGMGLDSKHISRITITNNKYSGKYTIIDKKTIERISSIILEARDTKTKSSLEPDFTFDFYDSSKNLASFKYTAGIDDESTANLIDDKGRLYHIDSSIEDEFISRLMKKDSNRHVSEYYESLLLRIFEKSGIGKGTEVVVDIRKDYIVTKSMTSIEQRRMIESINKGEANIKSPEEALEYDYYIKIDTRKYNDMSCKAYVTVKDKNGSSVNYIIEGNYNESGWSYFIKFK